MCFVEEQRNADRALRKVGRDIERDRRELEREEKKLVDCFTVYQTSTTCFILFFLGTGN